MRAQSELGRKSFVMDQIISDSNMSLGDELFELQEMPGNFINSVYETSYDEMSDEEIHESISWIKTQLEVNMC